MPCRADFDANYEFSDWVGAQRMRCRAVRPHCREGLVAWIQQQPQLSDLRMRAVGSKHSTSGVARPLSPFSIVVIVDDLVIHDDEALDADEWIRNATLRPGEHLLRVPGGMTVADLNRTLAAKGWALPNMGSYDGQTISGVLATGTHGSGLTTGPLPDIVASIEIVTVLSGPRVVSLRVEPDDGPTDHRLFTGARFGLDLLKNTEAFESCVVGLGAFGIVTAVTLRVVDAFWLSEKRWLTNWPDLAQGGTLQDLVEREPFVDIVMTPLPRPHHLKRNHRCLVTIRRPIAAGGDPPPRNDARRKSLEDELAKHRHSDNPQLSLTRYLSRLASDHPRVANYSIYKSLEQEAEDAKGNPLQSASHLVLRTSVGDLVMAHSAEIAVPLERTIDAVETTIEHLAAMHALGYHHGSPVGIRFGDSSRHVLAMHSARRTCTIEVPILLGMRRDSHDDTRSEQDTRFILNSFVHRMLANRQLAARVHWGQTFELTRAQIASAYPRWQSWERWMRRFNPYGIFDNRLIADLVLLSPVRRVHRWSHLSPIAGHPFLADVNCDAGAATPTGFGIKAIVAGDVDGDGQAELVIAPDTGGSAGNDVWVMKFDRVGRTWAHLSPIAGHPFLADVNCDAGAPTPTNFGVKIIAAADVDGDGQAELVIAPDTGGSAGNDLWVMKFNRTHRTWAHLSPIAGHPFLADVNCDAGAAAATNFGIKVIVIADVDGDGQAELVIAPDTSGTAGNDLWVMKFDRARRAWAHFSPIPGHGFLADLNCDAGASTPTGFGVKAVIAGDVDGDGQAELVIAPDTGGSAGNDLWVMKFDRTRRAWAHLSPIAGHPFLADVNCDAEAPMPTNVGVKSIVAADVDGDGQAELVIAPDTNGTDGNELWVMKFDRVRRTWAHLSPIKGHPFLADVNCDAGASTPTGIGIKHITSAHLDEDQLAELVVIPAIAGTAGNDLWVLKFEGLRKTWSHVSPIPSHPFAADVNCDDGRPSPFGARTAIAADVDGDGKDELIVAPDIMGTAANDLWVMKPASSE
jgi:FAD/FMN-containing dehydrogenase